MLYDLRNTTCQQLNEISIPFTNFYRDKKLCLTVYKYRLLIYITHLDAKH